MSVTEPARTPSVAGTDSRDSTDARDQGHGVLVVRHGLTQWNADSRWQGWADTPLSGIGLAQAEQAARGLAALLGDRAAVGGVRVVASDLERAVQTATPIAAAFAVDVIERRAELRERDIGEWSGLTTPEIEERWPGWLDRWREGALQTTPSGEEESVLQARIGTVLEELCRKAAAAGEIVIAVTHGGVIRTLERMHDVEPRPVANVSGRWFHWDGERTAAGEAVDLLATASTAAASADGSTERTTGTSL